MDKILALLTTPEKAKAMKAKLKAMPNSEKAKDNYKKIWSVVCAKVNEYSQKNQPKQTIKDKSNVQKNQKEKQPEKSSAQAKQQPSKSKQGKPEQKTGGKAHTKKSKKQGNKKPHKFMQPQYSEQDITTMIVRLERNYPKLFDVENPKPLKVGIFEEIVAEVDWNVGVLKEAIKQYARAEKYYVACADDLHRYDLEGERVARITPEEEQHAINCLKNIVGRFNLSKKYPKFVGRGSTITPNPARSAFYGDHYYEEKRYFEIKSILAECYGSGIGIDYKSTNQEGLHNMTMTVQQKSKVLFCVEAKGKSPRATKKLAGVKLLVNLQNSIEAYPFPYKKLNLSDDEIEQQFSAYYEKKHAEKIS